MPLFAKKERESVVLIDIDSSSIGGGLVHYASNEVPTIYFSTRLEITVKEHESREDALARTLEDMTNVLVTKGAPVLRQAVGSGHIERIEVTVGSPWQRTSIRTETMAQPKPFVFTRALLAEMTHKPFEVPAGFVKSVESTIATVLNGYDIPHPFGKRINRAEVLILTSLVEKTVSDAIEHSLRKVYHTHSLTISALAPVVYKAFRDIFPHEKDYLVLHVSGESTDLIVVKHSLLEDVDSTNRGLNELLKTADAQLAPSAEHSADVEKTWIADLHTTFQSLEKRHSLPRTVFLLSDAGAGDYLQKLLDTPDLRNLWLTDDPLRLILVQPTQFSSFLHVRGESESDTFLSILALYARKKQ